MQLVVLALVGFVGVRSLCYTQDYGCNDMGMYSQCERAQQLITDFAKTVISLNNTYQLAIPNLGCDKHVWCEAVQKFCQNMNAYDKCVDATNVLNNFITDASNYVQIPSTLLAAKPTFTCTKEEREYIWGSKVNDYYANDSSKITTLSFAMVFLLGVVSMML